MPAKCRHPKIFIKNKKLLLLKFPVLIEIVAITTAGVVFPEVVIIITVAVIIVIALSAALSRLCTLGVPFEIAIIIIIVIIVPLLKVVGAGIVVMNPVAAGFIL